MKVFVYKNLRKNCWSVKALEGDNKGRVIAHVDNIILTKCKFKVSKAGRARVLKEQQKNVHAGVVGHWSNDHVVSTKVLSEVTYNPYKYESFVYKVGEMPIYESHVVALCTNKVYA